MNEPAGDPRELIQNAPMSRLQVQTVVLTAVLSALDGFDILSTAFVAPVLARDYHVGSRALGLLLSSGLAGALIGSLTLAALADVVGRKPVVLSSLALMASGMLLSAFCRSMAELAIIRVVTGIGVGAMVVVINPIAVEDNEIFRGHQRRITAQVAAISFLTFLTNYYFLSWQPKILVDLGYGASTAASVSGASSLAGACACVIFGMLSRRFDARLLAIISITGLGVCVIAFGLVAPTLPGLVKVSLLAGGCVAAATVGLYVTAAAVFEPHVRATGTGFIIGIGRLGSALAPTLAGSLFALGGGRGSVSALIGACAVIASVMLFRLPRRAA